MVELKCKHCGAIQFFDPLAIERIVAWRCVRCDGSNGLSVLDDIFQDDFRRIHGMMLAEMAREKADRRRPYKRFGH